MNASYSVVFFFHFVCFFDVRALGSQHQGGKVPRVSLSQHVWIERVGEREEWREGVKEESGEG